MLVAIVVANVVTRKRSRRSGLKVSANELRHDSMTMMMCHWNGVACVVQECQHSIVWD